MSTFRIALANIQFPATPEESVTLAEQAIACLLVLLLPACAPPVRTAPPSSGTPALTIRGDRFFLDGRPFDMWGIRVASASQNERLTADLIENLDEYRAHGVNSLAVFYMEAAGPMDRTRIPASCTSVSSPPASPVRRW